MNKRPTMEATKDVSRLTVFGAISTIATYFLDLFFPEIPVEVKGAFLVLLLAGLTYLDSWIHHIKTGRFKKVNGLTTF